MYPVDTNALSSGAPGRREGAVALAEWLDARSDDLFLSTITVAEVGDGIARLRRSGGLAGLLMDRSRAAGHAPGFADLAIAATAGVHDLTVLTRNMRHFAPLDIPAHDPFESLPG